MNKQMLIGCFVIMCNAMHAQKVGIGVTTPAAKLDIRGGYSVPAIPNLVSTGIVRIGVSPNEGIDIGKMGSPYFAAWIQAGYAGEELDPLSIQPMGGNVGIGTTNPSSTLHVNGTIQVVDGTQGNGKVLTSDANGLASWQSPPPPPPPPAGVNATAWICCNAWSTKNLNVSHYRNGDPIPKVTSNAEWEALTTGAYCYYNNDSTMYAATYGKLYNWYAVNDPRGLSPEGWHIPTHLEWSTLGSCLGGNAVAGSAMKESGTAHWLPPNSDATNHSGFNGLPGGFRFSSGVFSFIREGAGWWSVTQNNDYPWGVDISIDDTILSMGTTLKGMGLAVRCVRD